MPYSLRTDYVGFQPIAETSTVRNHELGTRVFAYDPIYGMGEFIYGLGVASTIVGATVIFDSRTMATTLTVTTSRGAVGVAMSANVANQYGWYQISGAAVVDCGTVAANAPIFATAVAGEVDDAVVATAKIEGMTSKTANGTPSAGLLVAQIAYPSMNGNG